MALSVAPPFFNSPVLPRTPASPPQGIMVRHYAKKELSGFIRISVGKPEHTDALMEALGSI